MKCKKCGNELEVNTKFCGKCGDKVITEVKPVSEQKTEKKSPLASVISVIVVILAIGVGRYLTQGAFSASPRDLAVQGVSEAKASMILPSKIDEGTTLVDMTAEGNSIRYHYILSGIDTNDISNTSLKNYLAPSVCKNKDTRNLLDRGVGMEYSYVVENSSENFFISITKADCI